MRVPSVVVVVAVVVTGTVAVAGTGAGAGTAELQLGMDHWGVTQRCWMPESDLVGQGPPYDVSVPERRSDLLMAVCQVGWALAHQISIPAF